MIYCTDKLEQEKEKMKLNVVCFIIVASVSGEAGLSTDEGFFIFISKYEKNPPAKTLHPKI